MSGVPSTKRDAKMKKLSKQVADLSSAFQILSEEQRHINSKLDTLIALQQQNNPSLTVEKKPSRRATEAPEKTVRIRNPPVVSEVTFQEDEPTDPSLTLQKKPSRRATEAPEKTVRIRNPPVVSKIAFQEDESTDALLDVIRLATSKLECLRQISKSAHLAATIQDKIDSLYQYLKNTIFYLKARLQNMNSAGYIKPLVILTVIVLSYYCY